MDSALGSQRLRSRALLRGRSRFRSSGLLSGGALRGRLGGGAGGSLPLRVLTLDVRLQIIQASGLQIGDVLIQRGSGIHSTGQQRAVHGILCGR